MFEGQEVKICLVERTMVGRRVIGEMGSEKIGKVFSDLLIIVFVTNHGTQVYHTRKKKSTSGHKKFPKFCNVVSNLNIG